jgi:hypothetical protein
MKRSLTQFLFILTLIYVPTAGFSQYSIVLADSFQTAGGRIDLSELIVRFGETEAASAFEIVDYIDSESLSFPSIHMNAIGEAAGVCCTYDNGSYLAHNCIDFEFPEPILRSDGDTLKIEFDGIWELANDKKGESSKLIAYLIYNYPEGGPPAGVYNDLSQDFYGKPAYQLWILNGSNRAFMTYGGGLNEAGTFIKLPADNPEYWLPGFTEKRVADGEIDQQDPYPASDYGRVMEGSTVSDEFWMHYTWEITEDRLSLFWRKTSEAEEKNEILFFMEMPENGDLNQINAAHGTFAPSLPPFYEWIDEMNAFRMFINMDSYITNLKISKTGTPQSTYFMFAKSRVKVDESEGVAQLPVLISNPSDSEDAKVEISLVEGDATLIDGFTTMELDFPVGGPASQSLNLTITGDEDIENDKLVFELTGASGGNYATTFNRTQMELIIEDGPSALNPYQPSRINAYPNPSNHFIEFPAERILPGTRMEIYDISGKILISVPDYSGGRICIESLQEGLYFINLDGEKRSYKSKFIKK